MLLFEFLFGEAKRHLSILQTTTLTYLVVSGRNSCND